MRSFFSLYYLISIHASALSYVSLFSVASLVETKTLWMEIPHPSSHEKMRVNLLINWSLCRKLVCLEALAYIFVIDYNLIIWASKIERSPLIRLSSILCFYLNWSIVSRSNENRICIFFVTFPRQKVYFCSFGSIGMNNSCFLQFSFFKVWVDVM